MENTMKVEQFYNKNQFLLRGDGVVIFQSYDSIVAKVDKNGLTLGRDWDYSKTTLKHLYIFLAQLCYGEDYTMDEGAENAASIAQSNIGNKRAEIQDLIDNGIIHYNPNM